MSRSTVFTVALSKLTALRSRQKNWLGTCLAGLTRSLLRGLAFQLFFWLFELPTSKLKPPENKKPGVERRAQPPLVALRETRQIATLCS